jgi:DNA-binding transcriptional ArsR family regulator
MARQCKVCMHPDRREIDRRLAEPTVNISSLSTEFDVSYPSLRRHRDAHLPATLAHSAEAREVAHADTLVDQLKAIQERAHGLLDKAEEAGNLSVAVRAVRELRGNLDLLARLSGELDDRPQVNVLVNHPVWLEVKASILQTLRPFPDAHRAVLRAIEDAGDE